MRSGKWHADRYIDVNYAERGTGLTALRYAAARNARAMVKLLAASGLCDFTRPDSKGRTAATLATEVADNPALARFLYDCAYRQAGEDRPHGKRTQESAR